MEQRARATVFTSDAMIDDDWTTAHVPGRIISVGFKLVFTLKITFALSEDFADYTCSDF